MKYSTHLYAKALAEIIASAKKENEAHIVKNFLALLRKNGDEAHLGKILEEAAKMVRAKDDIRKVAFETARPLTHEQKESLKHFIKHGDVVEEKVDSELIAGVRIIVDDEEQFDGSLRGKLDKLFAFRNS